MAWEFIEGGKDVLDVGAWWNENFENGSIFLDQRE